MLDERKERAITLLLEGNKPTNISIVVGCARQTIYEWLKNDEFATELDRRRQEIITSGNSMILNKLSKYIDGVDIIALDSESDKSRLDALTYLIDRVLGKTTTRIEATAVDNKDNVNIDVLDAEINEIDAQ